MSYLVYINGNFFETEPNAISQTKQVNDIGSIADRQTNYTNRFIIKRVAKNIRNFDNLGLVGSESNIPYQRNEALVFDSDTGECLIYKGWANVNEISEDEYDVYIYDGIVDFYKTIENKTLSDVGVPELNHLKNLQGILDSWDESNNLPYRYNLADYGGKVLTDDSKINIDYLIPSALVKYIWDRIFDFFGFTYSGSTFDTEDFQNLWLTYPKPVGSLTQEVISINNQNYNQPLSFVGQFPTENGINYVTNYQSTLLQVPFSTPEAESENGQIINTFGSGLFRFTIQGTIDFPTNPSANFGVALFRRNTITNSFSYETLIGGFQGPATIDIVHSFVINDNEEIGLHMMGFGIPWTTSSMSNFGPTTGNLNISFQKVLGDVVNFDAALINFQVKSFFDEILNHFGLTPFKDRFSNNIKFLTLTERLQTSNILNWSSKYSKELKSKTVLKNYAQRNYFRYLYNQEMANHNDGFFSIENKNLDDAVTVFQSKIFTIEKQKTSIAALPLNIYKFWNKEIKDDATVEYKELDNRFYFMRSKRESLFVPITLKSEVFEEEQAVSTIYVESYFNLRMQEVINNHYKSMAAVLNKSKVTNMVFNLNTIDVNNFNFESLIYIEQKASYYLANKILNFKKGNLTQVELIEVKYFSEFEDAPVINNGTYIRIISVTQSGCDLIIQFDTDADLPTGIRVIGSTGLIFPVIFNELFNPATNELTVTLPEGGLWEIRLFLDVFGSSVFSQPVFENLIACSPEPEPGITFITITSIETLSVSGNNRNIRIHFDTDLALPNPITVNKFNVFIGSQLQPIFNVNQYFVNVTVQHSGPPLGLPLTWAISLSYLNIFSNTVNSNP